MDIQVACQHTTLTPALREVITEKFAKIQHHTSRPLNAHVTLTANEGRTTHKVESTLTVDGTPYHAHAEDGNMYAAIDQVVHKLDRQMRKAKTARLSTRGTGPSPQEMFH